MTTTVDFDHASTGMSDAGFRKRPAAIQVVLTYVQGQQEPHTQVFVLGGGEPKHEDIFGWSSSHQGSWQDALDRG